MVVQRNNNVKKLIYFFLSTIKKFIIIFFQLHYKKIQHGNKRCLQYFRSLYCPRTKSGSNVRVNVPARSKVLARTRENEIVLLRNYKIRVNYKISFY